MAASCDVSVNLRVGVCAFVCQVNVVNLRPIPAIVVVRIAPSHPLGRNRQVGCMIAIYGVGSSMNTHCATSVSTDIQVAVAIQGFEIEGGSVIVAQPHLAKAITTRNNISASSSDIA